MKKIITLMFALLAIVGAQAEEKTVWEGEQAISWNPEEAPGIQFETPDGTFSGLKKDNTIRIYTTTTYESPQYVITYKKGDGWEWTDLNVTVADGIISYVVESDDVATFIAERGIIVRGQAYTITKITVDAEAPKPVEGEQTVWTGEEPISWNPDEAPGTQYETPDGTFVGLQKGDVIRLYTTTTYAEPQYVITYKKGDGWEWTDLETTIADGVISYTVESDEVATWIAERGLIMRGQAYTLTKITVTKQSVTTIVVMQQSDVKDSRLYNLRGQMVDENYKGIVVSNGRKYLK